MSGDVSKPERVTQNRVISLFVNELDYRYLGDWQEREGNSNFEQAMLTKWLLERGYHAEQISQAITQLQRAADPGGRNLYHINQGVYQLLRYGVRVKIDAGKVTETVQLIDWEHPETNDFAIAEEVTLRGGFERRPDLVLYVNGIAVAVIELKNSRVSISEGIRQLCSNQRPEFNAWFFSSVQFVFAGNDSEGLQYGTTGTTEKYFLKWKEDVEEDAGYKLDKYLRKMCRKDRLIELMHDFVLFDGGIKKVPRVHQYFGIKAAQAYVKRGEGGIIWHTQGSGKSIVMVLLAKWILEHNPDARIVIVTDRDELDKQIADVLKQSGTVGQKDNIRATSGGDLMRKLGKANPRLICTLVHKFGQRGVDNFEAFIQELEAGPKQTLGDLFVFVDECHRTQSGKLNRTMKAIMPDAVLFGFTGTPLLKRDKQTTFEVFGHYIHTYKFSEAVDDKVILDLVYEARDIDQRLGSEETIDQWFEAKTRTLNDWQKDELKKKWGTMQKVLSSKARMNRIVVDIVNDFTFKPRLSTERGNAILVAKSIFEACRYFELFCGTELRGKCAVITSYNPQAKDLSKEDTGEATETEKAYIYETYCKLLKDVRSTPGLSATETYEEDAKKRFIKEPATMKLLVVVDKLLTGFDAPPCSFLYIDKSMQDHGLFQAICRTNRLDDEDKEFGNIVDYMDLFRKVENAIAVYSSELDDSAGGACPEVEMKDRLTRGRERLEEVLEALELLCEAVESPKSDLDYLHYFCGNTEIASDLEEREPQRVSLYRNVASLVRAYANLQGELGSAGYSVDDCERIEKRVRHYVDVREHIRNASGESLDVKAYEADMRHLIDHFIEADRPQKISSFDHLSLVELIVKTGVANAIASRLGKLKHNQGAIAETIENNVRSKIIREHLNDPAFYDRMSVLLEEIIADRRRKALDYEAYLRRVAELAKQVWAGHRDDIPEVLRESPALRAIYNNLESFAEQQVAEGRGQYRKDQLLELAVKIDETVRKEKPDNFRGNDAKERKIMQALLPLLHQNVEEVIRIFDIIKKQAEY